MNLNRPGTKTSILHLVPSWEHVGAVRRIGMLAAHLEAPSFEHQLVALCARGPDPNLIMRLPLACTALAAGPRLGVTLAWRLRRTARTLRPDVVHAWSRSVNRVVRVALLGLSGVRVVETLPASVPPAIDLEQLRREIGPGIARRQLMSELGLPDGARLLGTLGQLTREKQVIELLWALDQIRCVREDVYLLVIGDGDARPLFERYARLYQIADHVRFLGWRTDAAALVAQLDVYCTASVRADCSQAVLEAMALGVPVVAADTPANRRVIAGGETGFLVDIAERSEMARWCLRVLEDADLAARMREASLRQAGERFVMEPFLRQCRAYYETA